MNHKMTTMNVHYKKGTSVTSLTGNGWSSPLLDLKLSTTRHNGTSAVSGNTSGYFYLITATILDINLAPGEEIMFCWDDSNNNDISLAIDDVTITPTNSQRIFYNTTTGNLQTLANWTMNANGTIGTTPKDFTSKDQTFIIKNSAAPTISGDWTVSGQNSKVILGDGVANVNFTIPTASSLTGIIDVTDNATLTINNATLPTLGILDNNSTVNYNSSTTTLPGVDFGFLVIGNGNKNLAGNTIVKKKLTLNSPLELGGFNLSLEEGATIENASATNYIITQGNGRLKMKVNNTNQDVVFPVGTDKYLPIKIKQIPAGTSDFFSVKVINGVFTAYDANNNPIGAPVTERAINKTWIIDEEVIGGSNVSLTIPISLKDLINDVLNGFDIEQAGITHYESNKWDNIPAHLSFLNAINLVDKTYEVGRTGITSFSPFTSVSPNAPLPVELTSFTAARKQNAVVCNWETTAEINNDYFAIERSSNGSEFTVAGYVKGKGTTSQTSSYTFSDLEAQAGLSYYRLRQTDFDGTVSYSKIVIVKAASETTAAFNLYPNPSTGQSVLQTLFEISTPIQVSILNVHGQEIKAQMVAPSELRTGYLIDLMQQANGIYFIRIVADKEVTILRAVKQ